MKLTQVLFVTVCLTLFVGLNSHEIKRSSESPLVRKDVFKDEATSNFGKRQNSIKLVSHNHVTRQSSTMHNSYSGLAVDGNKNQNYPDGSCSHTNNEINPWWEVYLSSLAHIKSIKVYNRDDCCGDRLSGFKVLVSNDSWNYNSYVQIADGPQDTDYTPVISLPLDTVAAIARIALIGIDRYLALCEVEIYGSYVGELISRNRNTRQSSTYGNYHSQSAVDGNRDQNIYAGSCIYTAQETDPWWEVYLSSLAYIMGITVYNVGRKLEAKFLSGFKVLVSNDSWSYVEIADGPQDTADTPVIFLYLDAVATTVRIEVYGHTHLTLCEVEIYGSYVEVNGNWGKWSAWESCSVTCGRGTQKRWRSCNDPAPQHGGRHCVGHSTEIQICSQPKCPVHGNWGKWSAWESCSATCGEGTQQRSRSCNDPEPQYGGNDCVGDSTEIQNCRLTRCLVQMKLEYTTYEKIYNNDLFFTGDIVQCSPSVMNVIKSTSIQFSCPSMTTITENCNDNICQLILNFIDSSPKTCTLVCNATVTDVENYKVNADKLSIISDENVILRLDEVNPAEGNLRESNYHVKCIVNRIEAVHSLYIMQDCDDSNDKIQKFYCNKRNCEVKISVDNQNAYCNISCHAELKDNIKLNKLKIDWKMVCITPQWSEWSVCSESCGTGWQTRQRRCTVKLTNDKDHDEETCYEGDYRPCVMNNDCDKPDDDPPLYFPPRNPPKAEIQYLWDITPSDPEPEE